MAGETEMISGIAGIAGFFIILFILFWILCMIVGILALIFWIFMIVDVAKRKFKNESDKVLWILVVILAGLIGAIVYYFVVKKPNKN